jgi:hypothetical protein
VLLALAIAASIATRITIPLRDPNFRGASPAALLRTDPALLYYVTERVVENGGAVPGRPARVARARMARDDRLRRDRDGRAGAGRRLDLPRVRQADGVARVGADRDGDLDLARRARTCSASRAS